MITFVIQKLQMALIGIKSDHVMKSNQWVELQPLSLKLMQEEIDKEYVSLSIGQYKTHGSVSYVAIRLLFI